MALIKAIHHLIVPGSLPGTQQSILPGAVHDLEKKIAAELIQRGAAMLVDEIESSAEPPTNSKSKK